jgi:hypothetical protein
MSFEDVELEFVKLLLTTQNLSYQRSSEVASILKDVVQQHADSDDSPQGEFGSTSETSQDRLAGYLRAVFEEKDDEEVSIQLEDDSLQEIWTRQQEEIFFLRSTLKALARSSSSELPTNKVREAECASPVNAMHYPEVKRHGGREDCHHEGSRPDFIQMPCSVRGEGDLDDAESILSDVTPSEAGIRIVSLKEELDTGRLQQYREISETEIHLPRTQLRASCRYDFQDGRDLDDGHAPVLPALLRQSGTSEGNSFVEMAKGEIRNNRARCILHEIYFERWGLTLQGHYSGKIRNQLPHGCGVLRFDNGDFYYGQFECGLLEGEGSLLLRRDGKLLKYRGYFSRNEFVATNDAGRR